MNKDDILSQLATSYQEKLKERRAQGDAKIEQALLCPRFQVETSETYSALKKAFEEGKKPSEFFLERFPSLFGSWLPERNREAFLWAVDACLERPYELGFSRRAHRSSKYEDYVNVVYSIVCKFLCRAFSDKELSDVLSGNIPEDEKAFRDVNEVGLCPELVAYALDHGDAKVEKLIRAALNGDEGAPLANREVIQSVLLCHNGALHELLAQLLLAARLQEGLRQAICECADEGTIDGFKAILKVVEENNLLRFSSVKRALAAWTGLSFDHGNANDLERLSAKALRLLIEGLGNPNWRATATQSDDSMEAYMGLWSEAVFDIVKAEELAEKTIRKGARRPAAVCGVFLNSLDPCVLYPLKNRLAVAALTTFPEDLEIAAIFLPFLFPSPYREDLENGTLTQFFRDEKEAIVVRDALQNQIEQLKTKEKSFQHVVFPDVDVSLTKSDLIYSYSELAYLLKDEETQDRAIAMIPKIEALGGSRAFAVKLLLSDPRRESQYRGLYAALVDKEELSRRNAFNIADQLPVESLDVAELEKGLRLKADDLRVNCVSLLVKQKDDALLATIERLLGDSQEPRRRAAYDLVLRVAGDESRGSLLAACAALLRSHEPSDVQERLTWEAALNAATPENIASDDQESLFDETDAYVPDVASLTLQSEDFDAILRFFPDSELPNAPTIATAELVERQKSQKREPCATCLQARKDAQSLDELIEKYKEEPVDALSWDHEKKLLGYCQDYPPYRSYAGRNQPYPLAEVWNEWYAGIDSPERLARVITLLFAESTSQDARVDYLFGAGFSVPQTFKHETVMTSVCTYLWDVYGDREGHAAAAIAGAKWYTTALPEKDVFWKTDVGKEVTDDYIFVFSKENVVSYIHSSITCVAQIYWLFLGLFDRHAEKLSQTFVARAALRLRFENACKKHGIPDAVVCDESQQRKDYFKTQSSYRNGVNVFLAVSPLAPCLDLTFGDYLLAAYRGDVTERALFEFGFRPKERKDAVKIASSISLFTRYRSGRIQRDAIRNIKRKDDYLKDFLGKTENFTPEDERFLNLADAFYSRLEPVIVESEITRSDVKGEWTDFVPDMAYCVGTDALGRLLGALGSTPLKNSLWFSDMDRQASLCRLISICVPSDEDDADTFARAVKRFELSDKRLIELAMFNPAWSKLVGEYLKLPEFESAAYFLRSFARNTTIRRRGSSRITRR